MPPECQAPVQQCEDGDDRHTANCQNRDIRQSKHNTLLSCCMLTYNTIEMSPASGQEERRLINYGRGITCDAVIIITRIFPVPYLYKDFQGCTTHQAHSTDAHIQEGHVWLAGKLKIVIVPGSESLPFASLKGVLAAKKIIILIILKPRPPSGKPCKEKP